MLRGSFVALALAFPLAVGCGDVVPDQTPVPWTQDRPIERLVPSVATITLAEGAQAPLGLDAYYQDLLEPVSITSASWTSVDPTVASVDASTVTAIGPGRTTLYAVVGGVQSGPVTVVVGRDYDLTASTGSVRRGKLLDLVLTTPDADFAAATTIELGIEGLLPFGEERREDPWWGVVPGTTDRYRGVFLVPPTAPTGDLPVTFLLDGAAPRLPVTVEVQRNEALDGAPHGCGYFDDDDDSNWTFSEGTNQARTWLVGDLAADTLYRFAARSTTTGDVDPWMALWSLDGELMLTNEAAFGAENTDEAGIEITSLADDFTGSWFLTVAVSPEAVSSQAAGTLGTACVARDLPSHAAEATDGFPALGDPFSPGENVRDFDFTGIGGSVERAYVYLEIDVLRPDVTTVRLRTPEGEEVELIDPAWSDEAGVEGRWLGTLGAPEPFVPTASKDGTEALAGKTIAGVWELEVDIEGVGDLGSWYDAKIWLESQ